jgi:hypothetical protein
LSKKSIRDGGGSSVLCFYAENQYHVIRELPPGKGFADIVLLPKKRVQKLAMVVELKFKNRISDGD